jgi:hypothetical protein
MFHCSIPVRVALCCMFSSMEWHSHLYCCCLVFQHQTACPKLITLSPAFDRPSLAHPGSLYSSCTLSNDLFMNIHELCWRHRCIQASNAARTCGRPGSQGQAMTGQWQWCGNGAAMAVSFRCIAYLLCCELLLVCLPCFDIF